MLNWKKLLLSALVLLVLSAILLYVTQERDPIYRGKPLSVYLKKLYGTGVSAGGLELDVDLRPAVVDGNAAIVEVGPQALPMLVRMLKGGDSRLDNWLRPALERFPMLQRLIPLKTANLTANQFGALAAFRILGPRASKAVPAIIPMLHDGRDAFIAVAALSCIIDPAHEREILSLTNVFGLKPGASAHDDWVQASALVTLGRFGSNALAAEPFMIHSLSSTNGWIRASAAAAVARVGVAAEKVVPLIILNLPKTNPPPLRISGLGMIEGREYSDLRMTLWALAQYGTNAQKALPLLSNLQFYPVRGIRDFSHEAAAKIRGEPNDLHRMFK